VTHTEELSTEHPWLSLHKILPDNTLPAFADQTAILWGMGKKIGDTLIYKNEAGKQLNLKLIGGFANSVFQGNVIVAGDYFVKEFPSVSGANLFLLQTPKGYIPDRDFLDGWRHYGAEITGTRERLLMFGKIETTYLNIFLMLGALGLLIGTIGLGILIYRITLEQIPQYALLHSIGFSKARIFKLLFFEKLFLLLSAIFAGSIPAALSVAPIIFTGQNSNLWLWLPVTVTLVLVSGFLSIYLAIRNVVQKNLIRSLDEDLLSR
jgi:ABC-type antimicrobial peptide transport system permease subunit